MDKADLSRTQIPLPLSPEALAACTTMVSCFKFLERGFNIAQTHHVVKDDLKLVISRLHLLSAGVTTA